MKQALTSVFLLAFTFSAHEAAAQVGQAWIDRGYLNLNLGFQSTSGDLNDATTFAIYGENASLSVAQAIDSGALFDFSAGGRVWNNVSVGIGFHQGTSAGEATVQGSIPSPVTFNASRPLALSVNDLERTERAVHLQFGYMLMLTERLTAHVLAGPSFFKVRQNVVTGVTIDSETAPFTSVTGTAAVTERTDSPVGFNIGVDVAFQLVESSAGSAGAGMFLRYTGATSTLQVISNSTDSDLGGLQVGFGARFRF